MKKLLAISCLLLLSCAANQTTAETAVLKSECPKSVACTIELLKGKSMFVKTDSFGGTFYELEDSTEKNVVKYTYSKIVKGNIQDAGYREEVVFEIDKKNSSLSQTDEALQNSKMLFGRFCFCKGETGYYKVRKGKLMISGSKEQVASLHFDIDEVPQLTHDISFLLK